jgi:hypothetical protein
MATKDDGSLKRLGGGRWQTRDERFTIEPQSGTWVIVDAEQTDELGLALVRGPFPSLTAAKAAIADARTGEPAASPLAARAGALASRPPSDTPDAAHKRTGSTAPKAAGRPDKSTGAGPAKAPAAKSTASKGAAKARSRQADEPAPDPSWLGSLEPDDRRRARRLLQHLSEAEAPDAEGLVRRDLAGDVPALATYAIRAALEELGPDAKPAAVVRLLADGRDEDLGVRWRIVDDRGRRISLER